MPWSKRLNNGLSATAARTASYDLESLAAKGAAVLRVPAGARAILRGYSANHNGAPAKRKGIATAEHTGLSGEESFDAGSVISGDANSAIVIGVAAANTLIVWTTAGTAFGADLSGSGASPCERRLSEDHHQKTGQCEFHCFS